MKSLIGREFADAHVQLSRAKQSLVAHQFDDTEQHLQRLISICTVIIQLLDAVRENDDATSCSLAAPAARNGEIA